MNTMTKTLAMLVMFAVLSGCYGWKAVNPDGTVTYKSGRHKVAKDHNRLHYNASGGQQVAVNSRDARKQRAKKRRDTALAVGAAVMMAAAEEDRQARAESRPAAGAPAPRERASSHRSSESSSYTVTREQRSNAPTGPKKQVLRVSAGKHRATYYGGKHLGQRCLVPGRPLPPTPVQNAYCPSGYSCQTPHPEGSIGQCVEGELKFGSDGKPRRGKWDGANYWPEAR